VDCLAAMDQNRQKAAILLAKFGGDCQDHQVILKNLPPEINRYEICLLDRDHQMETVEAGTIGSDRIINVSLKEYAVALLQMEMGK
jgi:hypothetical protein